METDSDPKNAKGMASFIFLSDMRSSGEKLQNEIEQAIVPHRLRDILWGTRYFMFNPPFYDPPMATPDAGQGVVDDPALRSAWFMTDNPIGADETATAFQWGQLSCCINWLKSVVDVEAREVGRENVFIVGFGIGFAAATAFLLQMEERIGGLLGVYPVMPFHVDLKYIALDGQTKAVVNSWLEMERKEEEEDRSDNEEDGSDEEEDGSDEEEDESDEEEDGSEVSTGTLDADDGNVQTHEARNARVMGFFRYLASNWEAPTHKSICDRLDTSIPVVLLHGMDDEQVPFRYGKEAVETFWNLGYKAKLRIKDGEGHKLSRNMIGELFSDFSKQKLGKAALRSQFDVYLQGGAFEDREEVLVRKS